MEPRYYGHQGAKKIGRNNEVAVLTKVSLQEHVWTVLLGGQKKSDRIKEVAVRRGSTLSVN